MLSLEKWWCPFGYDKKNVHYRAAQIDQSFWHVSPADISKLTPENRNNPIWNEAAARERAGK